MNKKNRDRFKRMPLVCKWRWRGMSKTNYRKQGKRQKIRTGWRRGCAMGW